MPKLAHMYNTVMDDRITVENTGQRVVSVNMDDCIHADQNLLAQIAASIIFAAANNNTGTCKFSISEFTSGVEFGVKLGRARAQEED